MMNIVKKLSIVSFFILSLPGVALAGTINGTINGSSVQNSPDNAHPQNRDDYNYASTIDITSVNTKTPIFNAAVINWANVAGNPTYNFVMAGDATDPIGKTLSQIDPSDFNITAYNPWVTNSNNTTGFVTGQDATKYSRGVTNQDAGGANIVVKYTPTAGSDPKKFSFLQVITTSYFTLNPELPNNLSSYTRFDNGGTATSAYYNETGVSGVGTGNTNAVPLDATGSSGWMLDIPYRCESGFTNNGQGCPATTAATDGLITYVSSTFDTYIEADQVIAGTTYQVLYGGVEWGYTYRNADAVPEPGTFELLIAGLAILGFVLRSRGTGRASNDFLSVT